VNWKGIVSKANAVKHAWPHGWDRNDKVAAELGVATDRVSDAMRPAISAGLVEKQIFSVWNASLSRMERVTGWRQINAEEGAPAASQGARPIRLSVGVNVQARKTGAAGVVKSVSGSSAVIEWNHGRVTTVSAIRNHNWGFKIIDPRAIRTNSRALAESQH